MLRDEVIYRRATPADAPELAGFGSQSFVDAYGSLNSRRQVALHVERTYSEDLQRAELTDSGSWTIIGDREGEIVGAALMRWYDPPAPLAAGAKWAEIKRFYVGRGYWRTGISTDLMVAALQSIRDGAGDSVWLQVWEDATQAIGFYRKWGFVEVGEMPFMLGTEAQRDLVMARTLAGAP
jgi:diamine N-acetyltransferase